ncbi:hypothetical protein [Leifsonia sp. 71-9]|uniref:hypothetical protein n=1 Tax=Leifsonia sp. 71-9 TaxID=1895934 RepID=UPI0009296F84|nr:hypothetical protein [Leifsonia sp. 71-9]OJX72833.1 MAG: hypothetical protein BGO91_13775 [Leifsonia sp. 71-9]
MTYFGDSEAKPPAPERSVRPVWVTLLGLASIVGGVGFVALAVALAASSPATSAIALAGLAIAGAIACAGGYSYFMRER